MSEPHYWTFREWLEATVDKIATRTLKHTPPEHQDGYLRVQLQAAIRQALRHGRSGRTEHEEEHEEAASQFEFS